MKYPSQLYFGERLGLNFQRMLKGVEGKDPVKFYLYSGHDTTCEFDVCRLLDLFTYMNSVFSAATIGWASTKGYPVASICFSDGD